MVDRFDLVVKGCLQELQMNFMAKDKAFSLALARGCSHACRWRLALRVFAAVGRQN